jgi:hypothetical protein
MCATCTARHLLLDLAILIIGEEYTLCSSSVCIFLQPSVTSSLLSPNSYLMKKREIYFLFLFMVIHKLWLALYLKYMNTRAMDYVICKESKWEYALSTRFHCLMSIASFQGRDVFVVLESRCSVGTSVLYRSGLCVSCKLAHAQSASLLPSFLPLALFTRVHALVVVRFLACNVHRISLYDTSPSASFQTRSSTE